MGHACALLTHPETPQANAQSMAHLLHVNRLHQGAGKVLATSLQQSTVFNISHEERQNTASGTAASYLRNSHAHEKVTQPRLLDKNRWLRRSDICCSAQRVHDGLLVQALSGTS